jgi:multicomponent Na+:H+ antiporter subunit B
LKYIALLAVLLSGGILIYASLDLPFWGDPGSPASLHVSPWYLQRSVLETSVPNVVTSVLADYRGYDTMFETTVIFCAGLACFVLLRVFGRKKRDAYFRHLETGVVLHVKASPSLLAGSRDFEQIDESWVPHDLILKTISRMLIPFIQLFALYVVAHGHHSPGGGFQGGVILGASVILLSISYDLRTGLGRFGETRMGLFSATGVFIYTGIGALCLVLGSEFLSYAALAGILNVDPVAARSLGIFGVEVGVAITVMAVMIGIYDYVASQGMLEEGL